MIGKRGSPLRFIQTHGDSGRCGEGGRVLCTQRVRLLEGWAQVVDVELQVGAGADQAGIVQELAELFGREFAETRRLDFAEADFSKLLERCRQGRLASGCSPCRAESRPLRPGESRPARSPAPVDTVPLHRADSLSPEIVSRDRSAVIFAFFAENAGIAVGPGTLSRYQGSARLRS